MTAAPPGRVPVRWRKKPVVIEAHQWFRNGDHPADNCHTITPDPGSATQFEPFPSEGEVVRYFRDPDVPGDTQCREGCGFTMHGHGWIDTPEGGHSVCPGDWIITGVKGERYSCKPGIFAVSYEPAEASGVTAATPGQTVLPPKWSAKFRKRPVIVVAVQLIDDLRNHAEVAAWIEANGGHAEIPFTEPCLYVETPDRQAAMRADLGAWIVKDTNGEFRVLEPDVFEATYEAAIAAQEPQAADGDVALASIAADRNQFRIALERIALGTAGDPSVAADKALAASSENARRTPALGALEPQPAPELAAAMRATKALRDLLDDFTHAVIDLDDGARLVSISRLAAAARSVRTKAGLPPVEGK